MCGLLCYGDGVTPLLDSAGNPVADIYGSNLGQIDRTWTTANSFGGTLQATDTSKLADHGNHVVVGASLDHGRVFGLVQNLFNQHYYVSGTFFDTQGIAALTFNDPRAYVPGMPLASYAGVRASV